MTARLCLEGRVVDASTGAALTGVTVRAMPPDDKTELAAAATDTTGVFRLEPPLEGLPDPIGLQFSVGIGRETFRSEIFGAAELAREIELAIPDDVLARAFGRATLRFLDDRDQIKALEVGQSLALSATGVRPASRHTVTLSVGGEPYSTQELISDAAGVLPVTVVAPQFGLTDAGGREALSWEEAQRRWQASTLVVDVYTGELQVASRRLQIRGTVRQPNGFASDAEGRLRNAVQADEDELFVSLVALPKASSVRVFVVESQGDWFHGDPISPAVDADGRALIVETPDASAPIRIARAGQLAPGSYDLIARPVRYGFEADDELILQDRDIVIGRRHTGLVVRERWLVNSPILDGPVNTVQIAGSPIGERPYFRYRETFAVGENVWAALDPGIVAPGQIGHKAAFYVTASKTAAQWAASTALAHVPPVAPPEVELQAFCINANQRLVWPGANQVGTYDVVADFGNNVANPAAFVRDDDFDASVDMIDGYLAPGFRVVRDPGTLTEFAHVGGFKIDKPFLVARGEPDMITVADESGGYATPGAFATVNRTFAREALVRFPADAAGATSAAQISAARRTTRWS